MKRLLIFLLHFIPLLALSQNEQEWYKEYQKLESQYQYGKYYQCINNGEALLRKMKRKNIHSEYTVATKAILIKYQAALGLRIGNDTLLDALCTEWENINSSYSDSARIIGNIAVSNTAFVFTKYAKAKTFLEFAQNEINEKNDPEGFWTQQIRIDKMELYVKTMNYNQALEHIDATIEYQKKLTVRRYQITKKHSGKTVDKKLNKKEYQKRLNTLGYLNVLHAKIYRKKGDFNQADTLYSKNRFQMSDWKSKNDESFILNEFEFGLLKILQGDFEAAKNLRKIRNKFAQNIKFSIPNIQYNYMYEKELEADLVTGYFSKHKKSIQQYQREVTKNYSPKSTYQFTSKHLFNLVDYYKGKYRSYAKHMNKQAGNIGKYYSNNDAAKIRFLSDLSESQIKIYDFEAAEKTLNQIIEISEFNFEDSSALVQNAYLQLGSFYANNTTNYVVADSIFTKNYAQFVTTQLHPFNPLFEKYTADYALIDWKRDMFHESMDKYTQLASITKEKYGELTEEHAVVLEKMARVQIDLGYYPLAEKNLLKAVLAFKTDKKTKSLNYVYTLQALGELYVINGDYPNANRKLSEAYELSKKYTYINEMLPVYMDESLAGLYIELGNHDLAEEILTSTSALKKMKYGETHAQHIKTNQLLGKLYLNQGRLIEAEKAIQKAINYSKNNFGDSSLVYIENRAALIEVYFQIGDLERASTLAQSIIKAYEDKLGPTYLGIADVLIQKTKIELELNLKNDHLLNQLNRATGIVTQNVGDRHPKFAEIIQLRALIMLRKNELKVALIQLQAANLIFTSSYGDNHPKTADNQVNIAALYYQSGNYPNAIAFYEKAMSIYLNVFNANHPKYIYALSKTGWTNYASGNLEEAYLILRKTTKMYLGFIENVFPSLSSTEKEKYWNRIQSDFAVFNSLAVDFYKTNPTILTDIYNNHLVTKALLLNTSLKINQQIFNYGTPEDFIKQQELHKLQDSLIWAQSFTMTELDSFGYNIQQTRETINSLEKELSERADATTTNTELKRPSWTMVRNSLKNSEAAMEILRVNYFDAKLTDSVMYVALITKKETKGYPEVVVLNNGKGLEGKYFSYYRNSIKQKLDDTKSYSQYWEFFDAHLRNSKTIYFSAEGVYNQINPETFKNKKGQFLLKKYTFFNITNTNELVKQGIHQSYSSKTAVLIGNPKFSLNCPKSISNPLPGAEKEVNLLDIYLNKRSWNSETIIGTKATEKMIKAVDSPRILHIATHGFFLENTAVTSQPEVIEGFPTHQSNPLLRSGLLFAGADSLLDFNGVQQINKSDGILTALEAMNLNLNTTEMVFMSACETGRGDINASEGIFGLQHAFMVAGAKNVIMTLFKVDDKITQEFVQIFYTIWLKTGDKRIAFINAKKAILTKYKDPIYWGGFVMIGLD